MSAALQLPTIWAAAAQQATCYMVQEIEQSEIGQQDAAPGSQQQMEVEKQPLITLAFYRKHTESLLRRYLYSSMLVGRAPSLLDHPVARGWATSRPVRTFEEAVNFVLDVETCLSQLSHIDKALLSRIVLQEYTVGEAARMMGLNVSTVTAKLSAAVDRLTEILIKADLLVLPH